MLEKIHLHLNQSPEGKSQHRVTFHYEKPLGKIPEIPVELHDGLELSREEPCKSVEIPLSFDNKNTIFILKPETSTFYLHEALRKGFHFNMEVCHSIVLDVKNLRTDDQIRIFSALTSLIVLSTYEPTRFGKKAEKSKKKKKNISFFLLSKISSPQAREYFEHAQSLGESANLVRKLAELPANQLRPEHYTQKIRQLAKEWGLKFEFFDRKSLQKRGAGAFLAVVQAEPDHEYGIAKLTYTPKKAASGRRVALVGKGLCFDTGGYNIKTGDFMLEMHRDMTGSAVALASLGHFVRIGSKDTIECYLALAENLIGPKAYKPNEVVIASNGVSIEVVDTDAEGRMALSDTLVMACENDPDLVIDYATLTGAVIRAIDTKRSGVFSNSDSLRQVAYEAGEACGERVWGFPIGEDYWEGIHSEVADVRQCATTHNSDHIYAATFLSKFVKENTPWLHIDLASESNKGGLGLSSKDVTGFGVRLTDAILSRYRTKKKTRQKKTRK